MAKRHDDALVRHFTMSTRAMCALLLPMFVCEKYCRVIREAHPSHNFSTSVIRGVRQFTSHLVALTWFLYTVFLLKRRESEWEWKSWLWYYSMVMQKIFLLDFRSFFEMYSYRDSSLVHYCFKVSMGEFDSYRRCGWRSVGKLCLPHQVCVQRHWICWALAQRSKGECHVTFRSQSAHTYEYSYTHTHTHTHAHTCHTHTRFPHYHVSTDERTYLLNYFGSRQ